MRRALSALRGCRGAGPRSLGHLPDSALPSASAGGGLGLVASRATTPPPSGVPSSPSRRHLPHNAQRRAGTHLKQPESEAQRGPATSPRSHSGAKRGHAGDGPRAGARPRYGTHSQSCPRAPAPPRTPSGQRPWCAAGPGAPLEGRPETAWAALNWSRVGTRGPRRGAGSAWGSERPLIAAGGRSGAVLALAGFTRGRGGRGGGVENTTRSCPCRSPAGWGWGQRDPHPTAYPPGSCKTEESVRVNPG